MSKSVSRELQTQVDPELLRGIPLDLCLSGWARHFRPPDPGMFKVDHRTVARALHSDSPDGGWTN